jgi:hypothetical protein
MAENLVEALWVGPFTGLAADGTHLIPGETTRRLTPGEAAESSYWQPLHAVDPYKGLKKDHLQALVDERDLQVVGTGKDGSVKADDLLAALKADDQAVLDAAAGGTPDGGTAGDSGDSTAAGEGDTSDDTGADT